MANPLFNALGGGRPNMAQMVNQLKANPVQFLAKSKFNLPQNIDTSNAQSIVNYLVQSGQVSQDLYNRAYNMARQMGKQ